MNNNLELEKELNNVENVEINNIQDVEIQNDIKDINSKVDELNILINQKNSKSENLNVGIKKENNLVQNNNQVFDNKEKTIVDLKKEIFNHRNLVRWSSFCSIFSFLCFVGILIFTMTIKHFWEWIPFSKLPLGDAWIAGTFVLLFIIFGVFYVSEIVLNIIMLIKLNKFKKMYLPFFIVSFFILPSTWLYCMGLLAFMKDNNKINYWNWIKEIENNKMKKIATKENKLLNV